MPLRFLSNRYRLGRLGKTTFITDQGIYYYTNMPFDLKNVGALYHRLINKLIHCQMGKTQKPIWMTCWCRVKNWANSFLDFLSFHGVKYKISSYQKYDSLRVNKGSPEANRLVSCTQQLSLQFCNLGILFFFKISKKVTNFNGPCSSRLHLTGSKNTLILSQILTKRETLYLYLSTSARAIDK